MEMSPNASYSIATPRKYVLGLLKRTSADPITLINVYIAVLMPKFEYPCEVRMAF
jgi:hypothetical protein